MRGRDHLDQTNKDNNENATFPFLMLDKQLYRSRVIDRCSYVINIAILLGLEFETETLTLDQEPETKLQFWNGSC